MELSIALINQTNMIVDVLVEGALDIQINVQMESAFRNIFIVTALIIVAMDLMREIAILKKLT